MSRIVSLSDLQGFYVNSLAFMLEERLSFECEMGEFVRNLQHYLEVVFSTPRCYHPMLLAASRIIGRHQGFRQRNEFRVARH